MTETMKRFLRSIGIENADSFDIDFAVAHRNEFNPEQFDFVITKKTPWDYVLLEQFEHALETISYPYTIRFTYVRKPSAYDAVQLFSDWHRNHNRFPHDISLKAGTNSIVFEFNDEKHREKYEQTLKDFKEFLDFLNYSFKFDITINKNYEVKPKVSQKQMDKLEEKAQKLVEQINKTEVQETESSYYKSRKEIEEEDNEESLRELNETNKEVMEYNFELMKTERENAEKYKGSRGFYKRPEWKKKQPYKVFTKFDEIVENDINVDIAGEVFSLDKDPKFDRISRMTRQGGIGANNTAIYIKFIESEQCSGESIEGLKNGQHIRILGYTEVNKFNNKMTVNVDRFEILPPPPLREDNCSEKRVELHLHTKMSVMDGCSTSEDYIELAKAMGHKAIAFTDHGNVEAFPHVQVEVKPKKKGDPSIKPIYGCELYMVNNKLPFALNPKDIELYGATYVCFDLETTGLSARYCGITEFGAVKYKDGNIIDRLDLFINPEMPIPLAIQEKTRITDAMVKDAPTIAQAIDKILDFFGDSIVVSHNIDFDIGFLNAALERMNRPHIKNPGIDTLSLSRYMFHSSIKHTLGALSRNLGLSSYSDDDAHRADYDAEILSEVWVAMLNRLTKDNLKLFHSDLAKLECSIDMYKHMRPSHVCVLAKNNDGLHALYEIITESHTTYLADIPKSPITLINSKRENLLVGSACLNGEVFDTARTRTKAVLKEKIAFYDYIEIQPPENYSFLVTIGAETEESIIQYIKDIIEAAEELGKIVVATGDVHYRDPKDSLTRDIFISAKGIGGKSHPLARVGNRPAPKQHFRSTQEMLDAFEFLGKEKAYKYVVTNTNKIADMIGDVTPFDGKLRQPVLGDSPKELRDSCYERLHEYFGESIPQFIIDRLEKELNGIISNGYAVTYKIAHEIIKYSNENGYMVGSRGSVGSSLAAHLYDITEVNPLPPFYRCPHCKHYEFIEDKNVLSGIDLPNRKCPVCGEEMWHDGQNIPFETFLGFNGEKVPDIDLNFPSDFQPQAHEYTKVIFGEKNCFRAGTIETVADKTAFGYVKGFFERKGIDPNTIPQPMLAYIASKCVDVKRTTGQHPGGIVVLPKGMEITEFTPIQYPSDDKEKTWLTTHFDYHGGLDATLLKLDLLGHVDPMALKKMSNLTGIDIKSIPLNDKKVLSLFTSEKALNMTSNYLGVKNGVLGIPEFGTETSAKTLAVAKPKTFADLVIISGLSHGTMVWDHNAEDLLKSGQCTINEVIGCRDDIMTYLIKMGLDNSVAFKIMESVRKGKKVQPEFMNLMLAKGVPQWYIDSCNKIRYMFPKAHAVAYVTQAVRVGYFKIYHPLEFYAVWFSVRSKDYDIKAMLGGLQACEDRFDELKRKINSKDRTIKVTPKEKDIYEMLKIAIEMYQRGFKISNLDLYKSDATNFVVDKENGALIPPFTVIEGLGEAAANSVIEARSGGYKFTSKEDLLKKTKLNQTNVEKLEELKVLEDLGETEQMTLFDFGFGAN